jgi:hypothetical protein
LTNGLSSHKFENTPKLEDELVTILIVETPGFPVAARIAQDTKNAFQGAPALSAWDSGCFLGGNVGEYGNGMNFAIYGNAAIQTGNILRQTHVMCAGPRIPVSVILSVFDVRSSGDVSQNPM